MLSALLVAAAVSAAPPKVALMDVHGTNLAADTLTFYGEHLAAELRKYDLGVTTARDIATVVGLERQKEMLGCGEGSCMAELAAALGVDGVVVAEVGHVGTVFQVELKVLAAGSSTVMVQFSQRVDSEQAVLDALDDGAKKLSIGVHEKLNRPVPPEALVVTAHGPPPVALRSYTWVPGVCAGLFVIAGSVLLVFADSDYAKLTSPGAKTITYSEGQALASSGSALRWASVGCFAAAGAALVVAGLFATLGGPKEAAVAVAPIPGGAAVTLGGTFP
jgi:hypothetical protein